MKEVIVWTYIVLLVIGGLIGFFKAKSQVSLITAISFSALLSICASGVILQPQASRVVSDTLLVVLLVFFGWRWGKTRKFMPSGLMVVATAVTLLVVHLPI